MITSIRIQKTHASLIGNCMTRSRHLSDSLINSNANEIVLLLGFGDFYTVRICPRCAMEMAKMIMEKSGED